ncbi:LOW QUALITY PROTEIN: hypothetical protein ElyMa_003571200 [Elysia marginata]|uniref:Uncharacterized protein n=1 Tax=Elysia marginata TaxID=1093978 RepID=A0AAV4EMK8_9GAST|nr:LOW QUALITY PROTEIN: hypothetical protein ElyMa_003571200 [Elysia marginata]
MTNAPGLTPHLVRFPMTSLLPDCYCSAVALLPCDDRRREPRGGERCPLGSGSVCVCVLPFPGRPPVPLTRRQGLPGSLHVLTATRVPSLTGRCLVEDDGDDESLMEEASTH